MTGVVDIIEIENGVAVIATNTWYAFRAANAVTFDWQRQGYPNDTQGFAQQLEEALDNKDQDSRFKDTGNVDKALQGAEVIEAEYHVPYLAHATMEPMNATAWLHDNKLDVWAGNQIPTQIVKDAASITGLDEENITVHTTLMGGGFGRRLEMDFVKQAISIAKQLPGKPIKLTWSREEDTTHDYYRPMAMARFRATMGKSSPIAIDLNVCASSVTSSQMGRLGIPAAGSFHILLAMKFLKPLNVCPAGEKACLKDMHKGLPLLFHLVCLARK